MLDFFYFSYGDDFQREEAQRGWNNALFVFFISSIAPFAHRTHLCSMFQRRDTNREEKKEKLDTNRSRKRETILISLHSHTGIRRTPGRLVTAGTRKSAKSNDIYFIKKGERVNIH